MPDWANYLNPSLLWLAAGALAPIIIHLATRSRPKHTPFPAVRFIVASHRRSSVRFKLKQLLLLLLRIAALALFAFVVARPWVRGTGSAAELRRAKATVTAVLLLDNSYSMGCRHDDTTSFEKAKQMALAAVDAFAIAESRACLLLVADSPQPVITDFAHAYDLDALKAHIREAALSSRGTDCSAALKQAVRMLKDVSGVGKSVFLFTDLTAHAWPTPLPAPEDPDDITFYIADAGAAKPLNAAVLRVTAPDHVAAETPFEVKALVHAVGSRDRQVELVIDGQRRDQKPANAHQAAELKLIGTVKGAADEHWAAVTATGTDDLPADDSFHFTFRTTPPRRVALVNGAPSGVPRRDELFFLRIALAPGGIPSGQACQLKELRPADVDSAALADADVIVLCNVAALTPSAWGKIRQLVSSGRGLIVFAGDNVTPAAYALVTSGPAALLPCSIDPPVSPPEATHLEPGRLQHPILRIFQGGRNGDLAGAKFTRYLKLKTAENTTSEVVLRFKTGDPALVAGRYATGTVLVFASTCDADWNTLPIPPDDIPYAVLLHESLKFLTAPREQTRDVLVGLAPALTIPAPAAVRSVTLARLPDGAPEDVTPRFDPRSGQLDLPPIEQPGVYRVLVTRKDTDKTEDQFFAVNLDTAESDLERLPEDENTIKSLLPQRPVKIARDAPALLDLISRSESVSELTSHLAGIVLAVLLGEMYLSNRLRTRVEPPEQQQ